MLEIVQYYSIKVLLGESKRESIAKSSLHIIEEVKKKDEETAALANNDTSNVDK